MCVRARVFVCVHAFVFCVEPSNGGQISPLTRYMIEVSRKAALKTSDSSQRGNSTAITFTQVERACVYRA